MGQGAYHRHIDTLQGTWLGFFTLEEERALAARGDSSKPGAVNATKSIPLSPFIGKDLHRAQELAQEVNAPKPSGFPLRGGGPRCDRQEAEAKGRRRHWIFFLIILAVSIFAALARHDIHAPQTPTGAMADQ